ncbi:MAG: hypothetical protein E7436_01125 [Ruminococcaceae bacterium]|nr:hypothetical protein [Oscillospiraceae bacterium]
MAWKCELCDSYNEDGTSVCYVCGEERSAAAIMAEEVRRREEEERRAAALREEAQRRRAARREKIRSAAEKALGKCGPVLYYGSMVVAILALVLIVAGKVADGQVEDLWINLGRTLERGAANLEQWAYAAELKVQGIANGSAQALPETLAGFEARAGEHLSQLFQMLEGVVGRIFE